jgi:hypothetical protein
MNKPILILVLMLLSPLSRSRAQTGPVPHDPGLRFTVMPLLGSVGGLPGIGVDIGMGAGHWAWGGRLSGGTELCFMCTGRREETQISALIGARQEFPVGVIALKTGISKMTRASRGAQIPHYDDGYKEYHVEYETVNYRSWGVPFQMELTLGGRYVGLCLTATAMADGDGGSGGIMLGIPLGLLRR